MVSRSTIKLSVWMFQSCLLIAIGISLFISGCAPEGNAVEVVEVELDDEDSSTRERSSAEKSQPSTKPYRGESTPFTLKEPKKHTSIQTGGMDTGGMIWRTLIYAVLVLVLGGVVLFLTKRFKPYLSSRTSKSISVIETASLGPRQRIHLLEVQGRKILVGSCPERITMLADIGDESSDAQSANFDMDKLTRENIEEK